MTYLYKQNRLAIGPSGRNIRIIHHFEERHIIFRVLEYFPQKAKTMG